MHVSTYPGNKNQWNKSRNTILNRSYRFSYYYLFFSTLTFMVWMTKVVSMSSSSSAATTVRVVSYNVLSSHLAAPDYFTACQPSHLDPTNRLPKVLSKLENEIQGNTKTIFCLQEVSHDWAGKFHTFFANRGYHVISGLYGKKFNGYMGIILAYSTDAYETMDVDISRLSDKRVGGWPRREVVEEVPEKDGLFQKVIRTGTHLVRSFLWNPARKLLLGSSLSNNNNEFRIIDPWDMSENRFNILLSVGLRERSMKREFWISNYHMPCAFYAPMVMNIHAEMAAFHIQSLATTCQDEETGPKRLPYILAGDFNLLPDSPHYRLLTEGKLDQEDETYPNTKYGMEWNVNDNFQALRSAYAVHNGAEPDFTNYAKVKEDEPFIGTLDYIFLSPEWKVTGLVDLQHRSEVNDPPFPNAEEPSDHILIGANLELE